MKILRAAIAPKIPITAHNIHAGKYAPNSTKDGAPCLAHPPRVAEVMNSASAARRGLGRLVCEDIIATRGRIRLDQAVNNYGSRTAGK